MMARGRALPGGTSGALLALAVLAWLVARNALGPAQVPSTTLAGLLVGALVGLTGMGSGSLMAPILILLVGVPPVTAVGTDLAYAALTKIAGGLQHARQGTVDWRLVRRLAFGAVPAALVGVQALEALRRAYSLEVVNGAVTHALGLALALVALTLFWGLARSLRPRPAPPAGDEKSLGARPAVALGAGVGFLVSLTSVGSGSIIVAVLSLVTRLPARRIVGTDVVQGAILTAAAGLAHGFAGNVDLGLLLSLLAGSIPGVLLGSRLSAYLPERVLRLTLGVVLLATGVRLL